MARVIGIGNAIMDVIAPATDAELAGLGIHKGIMQLIDRDRSEHLMAARQTSGQRSRLVPGGSVANSLAGLGRLGLSTAFVGRVAADDLGRAYAHEMAADGTAFVNPPVAGADQPTSRSIISRFVLGYRIEVGPSCPRAKSSIGVRSLASPGAMTTMLGKTRM